MTAPSDFEKRLTELNLTYAQIELVKQAVVELVIMPSELPLLFDLDAETYMSVRKKVALQMQAIGGRHD